MSPAEAKAWLIAQILSAADCAGVSLDALEARMLEYSESARTPADLEALNEAFDKAHDQQAYEEKIASLIRGMLAQWRAEQSPKLALWKNAVLALGNEDHYLLVLIARADRQPATQPKSPAQRSWLRIFVIAVLVTTAITLLLGYLSTHMR
ncbi:MAG TPA: hypothetical protein VIM62_07945 [Acidobacteriaceae bacterium]